MSSLISPSTGGMAASDSLIQQVLGHGHRRPKLSQRSAKVF